MNNKSRKKTKYWMRKARIGLKSSKEKVYTCITLFWKYCINPILQLLFQVICIVVAILITTEKKIKNVKKKFVEKYSKSKENNQQMQLLLPNKTSAELMKQNGTRSSNKDSKFKRKVHKWKEKKFVRIIAVILTCIFYVIVIYLFLMFLCISSIDNNSEKKNTKPEGLMIIHQRHYRVTYQQTSLKGE